jgi:hypothetical protein
MIKVFKLVAFILVGIVLICGYSFLTDKATYSTWEIEQTKSGPSGISWAKFIWVGDSINGKYFPKSSMFIPCKMGGLPYNFIFQFDLGADVSGVYENNISSFYKLHPELQERFKRLRSPLQFWNNKRAAQDITILFGNYTVSNKVSYCYSNYGEPMNLEHITANDTFQLGTIGADLFRNKVLVIDYPNQRFAICDTIPNVYNIPLSDIELDKTGRILLPMVMKGKNYRIMFDNGSSIFPLIVSDNKINNFSTLPDTDTLSISSWGEYHNVVGRPVSDTFKLAGQLFSGTKVYADYRVDARTDDYDGITGNALFWDKTIIIDFKNKKFGLL